MEGIRQQRPRPAAGRRQGTRGGSPKGPRRTGVLGPTGLGQLLIPARLTSDSSRQAYVVERKYVLRLVESHRLSALV